MRDENGLNEKSKGKTREGASEPLTMGDLQSHRKMFNLIKNTFPELTVSTATVAVSFFLHSASLLLSSCFFQSVIVYWGNSLMNTIYLRQFDHKLESLMN